MRPRILRTAVATLAVAASAAAAATASAAPGAPGQPAHVTFSVNATAPPISGTIPTSLAFAAPGFTFDPKAVAKRCTHEQAILDECPAKSRIGTGVLDVHVVDAQENTNREAHLSLDIYLQTNTRVLAVAFIGGPKVVPAKISTSKGVVLSFNPLPAIPPFPGLSLTLDSINLNVGTSQTVVTRKRQKVGKKTKTVTTRKRYDLLHNPSQCTGSWPASVSLGFANGTSATVANPIACSS